MREAMADAEWLHLEGKLMGTQTADSQLGGVVQSDETQLPNARSTPVQDVVSAPAIDRAISRVLAEIHDGLRHGFFEFTVTCEIVGQGRRRLTLRAGKNHQFLLPKEECVRSIGQTLDSCDGSDTSAT